MQTANFLAEVWGISLVIVPLALLIKEKHIKRLFAKIETEESLFMWGVVSIVVGLLMVLSYNVWAKNWQVIITIFGWLSLIKGLSLLFLPELIKKYAKKIENNQWLPIGLVVAVFVGLILTYLGFTA
ncbi:MAG: hypothetical protein NTV36_00595 [Candidatus Staskawiczbacteria bacterium]|nr:hypothetical protein [Candidatus Staskawiczbacteria bacterium]